MTVERELPSDEARDLIDLVATIADKELAPRAAEDEERNASRGSCSPSWAKPGC